MLSGGLARILFCFTEDDTQSLVRLCQRAGYTPDLGSYYIRQLIQEGYLEKSDWGQYRITPQGKHALAIHPGVEGRQYHSLARPNVLLVVRRGETYVCLERSTQPFIGRIEWPAGALRSGETIDEAAVRILERRLGLTGHHPKLAGFFRRIDKYGDNTFDDKLFAVHNLTLPADTALAPAGNRGKIITPSAAAMTALKWPSRSLLDILAFVQSGGGVLQEQVYELTDVDFAAEQPPEVSTAQPKI